MGHWDHGVLLTGFVFQIVMQQVFIISYSELSSEGCSIEARQFQENLTYSIFSHSSQHAMEQPICIVVYTKL